MNALLSVQDLTVDYRIGACSNAHALEGVTFRMAAGESVGVLGESGSGKTTLAMSIPALLPTAARVLSGRVMFCGEEMLRLPERELRRIRGAQIGLIFQEPGLMLSPALTVGRQIADVLRAHREVSRAQARLQTGELLEQIGFSDPQRILRSYPHELSGGERQRIIIAQAVICRPALIIADEPTSSLDTTTQAEILNLLRSLRRGFGSALMLISHDPAVISEVCERVVVLHEGRIVEDGGTPDVFRAPKHEYTKELVRSRAATGADPMCNVCAGA